MRRLILASASPRRAELIKMFGEAYEIIPSDADEAIGKGLTPYDAVVQIACKKALSLKSRLSLEPEDIIVAADTVVVLEGKILTKPKDDSDAFNMLSALSAKTHLVMSGVCLASSDKDISFCEVTQVHFAPLSEKEIKEYIATGECADKAGAYAIQGKAGLFISAIEGCYYNVMGLPVAKIYKVLKSQF